LCGGYAYHQILENVELWYATDRKNNIHRLVNICQLDQ
jgi:hypothetical protein